MVVGSFFVFSFFGFVVVVCFALVLFFFKSSIYGLIFPPYFLNVSRESAGAKTAI